MLKHNKKRNVGIVYEQLLNLTTRLAVNKKQQEMKFVVDLMKRYFHKNSPLTKERKIFEGLAKTKNLSPELAEKVIEESLREISQLDSAKIQKIKSQLISEINKGISSSFWNIPIRDYKTFSSIQILINEHQNGFKDTNAPERVKIRKHLVESLCETVQKKEKPVDSFTFTVLMNKFNKRYSQLFCEDQKEILRTFILSSIDQKVDYKPLFEAKIRHVSETIGKFLNKKEVKNAEFYPLLKESHEKIKTFDASAMDEAKVYDLMKFYDLIEDLNEELAAK